jgi:hypothetical protein
MREFKFFQKGTVDMIDGETYATASLNDDTPEGHMGRRRLYHTREMYQRPIEGDVITQQQWNLNRDAAAEQGERLHRDLNDNPIRLFQSTRVTTLNPKWRTKIKMVFQEMSIFFKSSPYGIMFIWASSTIGIILILSKILNVW